MMRGLRITVLSGMMLCLAAASLQAAEKFITIGTADELGVYYPTGGAICRLVKRGIKDHGIRCFVEASSGSIDNLIALHKGEQDLALVQSDWAYDAYHGKGAFASNLNNGLRMVFSLHTEAFAVLVRADSGIRSFEQLAGKRVNLGPEGSGSRALMEKVMKEKGWSRKDFRNLMEYKTADQGKLLCGRKIDAAIYAVGHPNGAIQEASALCSLRLVPLADADIVKLLASSPYYYKTTIPAAMYRGTLQAVPTFGVKALLLTSEAADAESVYRVAEAVFSNLDNFKTLHPVFASLKAENMIRDDIGIPLHPGAARYYKESGLLK